MQRKQELRLNKILNSLIEVISINGFGSFKTKLKNIRADLEIKKKNEDLYFLILHKHYKSISNPKETRTQIKKSSYKNLDDLRTVLYDLFREEMNF